MDCHLKWSMDVDMKMEIVMLFLNDLIWDMDSDNVTFDVHSDSIRDVYFSVFWVD